MSSRPGTVTEPLDLAIRARRGEVSPADRRELERGIASSAVVRTAHRVGRDFDRVLAVRPGDEALLERVSRAAGTHVAPAPRRRRLVGAVLGVAAALVVGTAGATVATLVWRPHSVLGHFWLSGRAAPPSPSPAHVKASPKRDSSTRMTTAAPAAASPSEALAPGPASAAVSLLIAPAPLTAPKSEGVSSAVVSSAVGLGSRARRAPSGAGELPPDASAQNERLAAATSTSAPSPAATSAAALFHGAGAARRAGELARAKELYQELQASFPATEEARISLVSLGKLLLASGNARGAEQDFARYLSGGNGDLAEEALVGRAESLKRLGERGEERRVWAELLARFGGGVYGERARARLQELEHVAERTP